MLVLESKLTAPVPPVGSAYHTSDRAPAPTPPLRDLTTLEQMYGYWGSDSDPDTV